MDTRRRLVRKSIFIMVNSVVGTKCAAIYELKMRITNIGGMHIVIVDRGGGEINQMIEPTKTFYEQRPTLCRIDSVSACLINSSLLYLIPDDADADKKSDPLAPCTFYLYNNNNNKKEEEEEYHIEYPKVRKPKPVVMNVGGRVFSLANKNRSINIIEQDCFFESLDTNIKTNQFWIGLACPPFLKKPHVRKFSEVTGFVVLEEEGYILVCLQRGGYMSSFYSYNIRSNTWKPVELKETLTCNVDLTVLHRPPELHGEGVVVRYNNCPCYIYTYNPWEGLLLVFSYSVVDDDDDDAKNTTACDISLHMALVVRGLEIKGSPEFSSYLHIFSDKSGVVAIVDDLLLCVVHTLFTKSYNEQHVFIMFLELIRPHLCITVKSFTRTLYIGEDLRRPVIKSCFVLDDVEEKSGRRCGT